MSNEVKGNFFCYLFLWFIIIFATSLIIMIYTNSTPKETALFRLKKYLNINYKTAVTYNFLYDLYFSEEIQANNEYNSSLLIDKTNCIGGTCYLNSNKYNSTNCSEACVNNLTQCYYEGYKCDSFECNEYSSDNPYTICEEFNRIKKWRNTEMLIYYGSYEVIPYYQIKPKDEKCPTGFRKCGILNEDEDFLCLEENFLEFKCPINNIIVKSDNNPPNDGFKYTQFKIGDKYIFYTNETTYNYIFTKFYITFDDDEYNYDNRKVIDIDLFYNLTKYNKISFDRWAENPVFSFLNVIQFNSITYKEMIKAQEKYEIIQRLYSDKKIDDMNSKVKNFRSILKVFGIINFIYLIFFIICVLPKYGKGRVDITPIKRIIDYYIILIPCIVFSIFGFIITFIKIIIYNNYQALDYYDEVLENYYFEKSYRHNKIQFICFSININIIILLPILVKKTVDYS